MRLFTQTELLLPIPDSILLVVVKLFILQKSSELVGTYITVAITQAVFSFIPDHTVWRLFV